MYYNDYEDYMRNVLGYSNTNDNTYCSSCNVEQMYPEIYKIINPMVCRMCDNNTAPVTEYLIEHMTDEIYDNVVTRVEVQNVINLNIGTREIDDISKTSAPESRGDCKINKTSSVSKNSSSNIKQNDLSNTNNRSIELDEREVRSPQPIRRNRLLRDLIRILILNRIIRPGRPRPNRPPFIPGPGPIGPRPPMPRYDEYQW